MGKKNINCLTLPFHDRLLALVKSAGIVVEDRPGIADSRFGQTSDGLPNFSDPATGILVVETKSNLVTVYDGTRDGHGHPRCYEYATDKAIVASIKRALTKHDLVAKKAEEDEKTAAIEAVASGLRSAGGLKAFAQAHRGAPMDAIAASLGVTLKQAGLGFRLLTLGVFGGSSWETTTKIKDLGHGTVTEVTVIDNPNPELVKVRFGASRKMRK